MVIFPETTSKVQTNRRETPVRDEFAELVDPSASIVICNYNHVRFLPEAIASALRQSMACQVIVVDDGSTDGSVDFLRGVDPRVSVLLQSNAGQVAAYNAGFARATGDIVLFLDADDRLSPDAMRSAAPLFARNVAKVHFRMRIVDGQGRASGGTVPASLSSGDPCAALVRHGVLYPSPPGSGNVYRRDVLQRLFPLPDDPTDRVGADFFAIYGCVAFGSVAACPDVLADYRLHRQPSGAPHSLVFGNASLGNDEARKVVSRYGRLIGWVQERTRGAVRYPQQFLDFSVNKSVFAQGVFDQPYLAALRSAGAPFARLLGSIWRQAGYSPAKKAALTAWGAWVLVAPRPLAWRAARYVCNPASRA